MKNLYAITIILFFASCSSGDNSSSGGESSSTGKGGSMARFCISGDYLYTVDNRSLKMFNISEPSNPQYYENRTQNLGFGIETVFPMDTLLFIGSQTGMYIYDISDRRFPQYLSLTSHIKSCDPVVAQGKYAYVTLNTESVWCGRVNNVLQLYDITNPRSPQFIREMPCNSPKGLGVDNNYLFLCDKGLKIFDISNPEYPKQIDDNYSAGVTLSDAYDVIPRGNNTLVLTAASGIYQFEYGVGKDLKLLSIIEINR